jgi:ubiquinone/menaquinone biosynthesis C-methylase UbiE
MDLKPWKHPDVVGSVFEIPFDDGRFDAVTMLELVEHITPARQHLAIHEIARVLRRGGICVISTPNLTRWWDKPYRIVWWVWERTIQREYLKDHIGMVRQEYTERLLRKHFFLVLSQRIGLLDRVYLCVKP